MTDDLFGWSNIQTYNERCRRSRSRASLRQGRYRQLHQLQTMRLPHILTQTLPCHPSPHVGSSRNLLCSHSTNSTSFSSYNHSDAQCHRPDRFAGLGPHGSRHNSEDIAAL